MTVGVVVAPFGRRGEVQVELATDFPERFRERRRYHLDGPRPGWAEVEGVRFHQGRALVKFRGCDDRGAAEALRGSSLQVPPDEIPPLPAGTFYHFQLIGLEVVTDGGVPLGRLVAIHRTGAHDVFEARTADGRACLIPALRSVVRAVDLEARRLVVSPPPGLIGPTG